jgi:predicted transcriptional regulator
MMTVSLSDKREKSGPLSKNSTVLLSYLEQEGSTKAIPLREKASMIRSRFYKALYDLKELGLVKLGSV